MDGCTWNPFGEPSVGPILPETEHEKADPPVAGDLARGRPAAHLRYDSSKALPERSASRDNKHWHKEQKEGKQNEQDSRKQGDYGGPHYRHADRAEITGLLSHRNPQEHTHEDEEGKQPELDR